MVVGHTGALLLLIVTSVVAWVSRPQAKEETTKAFREYRWNFLLGFGLLALAQAFISPWGRVLFYQLHFSEVEVAIMYVLAPFFWTPLAAIGSIVIDQTGRKSGFIAVCAIFFAVGVLSHFRYFLVMTVGTFLDFAATIGFWTVPESWLVHEHVLQQGLSGGLLSNMFAEMWAIYYGAGIVASYIVVYVLWGTHDHALKSGSHVHVGGIHAAFAAGVLASGAALYIAFTRWHESQRCSKFTATGSRLPALWEACKVIRGDERVAMLGAVIAIVAMARENVRCHWLMALHLGGTFNPKDPQTLTLLNQHSVMGMASLCGVSLSTVTISRIPGSFRTTIALLGGCIAVHALALCIAATAAGREGTPWVCVVGIFLNAVANGFFLPLAGTLKGEIVPDNARTTLYTLFELVGVLFAMSQVATSPGKAFFRSALMLFCALGFLVALSFKTLPSPSGASTVDAFYQNVAKEV